MKDILGVVDKLKIYSSLEIFETKIMDSYVKFCNSLWRMGNNALRQILVVLVLFKSFSFFMVYIFVSTHIYVAWGREKKRKEGKQ